MDYTILAAAGGVSLLITLTVTTIAGHRLRQATVKMAGAATRDAIDRLKRDVKRFTEELEAGQITIEELRTERMKAVATFRRAVQNKQEREASGTRAGGVPENLQRIIDHPAVKGIAWKYKVDPEAFLRGDSAQIDRVEAILKGRGAVPDDQGDQDPNETDDPLATGNGKKRVWI